MTFLARLTPDEQTRMRRVVTAISKVPEIEIDDARGPCAVPSSNCP